jgi:hypothetical protein
VKKVLIILSVSIVIIILGALYFLRSTSGFRSIYFVPKDASLIIESKDPFGAWNSIVHSKAWEHYKSNPLLSEINAEIESYDSIVNSSKVLFKLIGKKSVMISQHPLGNNQYDFIYIIDIGKLARYKKPEKIISSVLGRDYEVTSRVYMGKKIVELLDIEDKDNYFLCFAEGKIIFSFNPKLIESSIDAAEKMTIGRDIKYLDVKSKLGNAGLFSVYIVHSNFTRFMTSFSPDLRENMEAYTKEMLYTGFNFDFNDEGLLSLVGYSSFSDAYDRNYLSLLENGKQELFSAPIIPQRVASLIKINFDDASEFFKNSMKQVGEDDYQEYEENIKKFEKKLKINLDKNLFSWMDKEIVMLQTQPSNLGRDNEFAVVLHARDSSDAVKNLQVLWRQIRKNTPIKLKTVEYKGYSIDYIAFPGIIRLLFGKALKKIEKPYFSVIGDNVVISNHPQTLKNIIDDNIAGNTFEKTHNYYTFNKNFERTTSAYIYFEPPVLYLNMKAFLSPKSWSGFQKNKKYITCFSQAGIQVNESDDLLHYVLKAQYQPEVDEMKIQYYNVGEIMSLFNYAGQAPEPTGLPEENKVETDTVPVIIISDLDAREYKEYYDNGNLKLVVELKDGLKHGTMKYYYENGELKIRGQYDDDEPVGKWKYYNEEGNLIKTDKY